MGIVRFARKLRIRFDIGLSVCEVEDLRFSWNMYCIPRQMLLKDVMAVVEV